MPGAAERGDVALVRFLQYRDDIRVLGEVADVRHTQDGPESPSQLDLLLGCQVLVAHEQHRVVGDRSSHHRHRLVRRVAQIDAGDLRATGSATGRIVT